MLVLTRKLNERILIGDDIVITLVEVRSDGSVRIGIDAPKNVRINRDDLREAVAASNTDAASSTSAAEQSIVTALGRASAPRPTPMKRRELAAA